MSEECKCVFATAENTESVRRGFEMGGYLKKECEACKASGATPPSPSTASEVGEPWATLDMIANTGMDARQCMEAARAALAAKTAERERQQALAQCDSALRAEPAGQLDAGPYALALNVKHKLYHQAADAFWTYWKENGETHKRGYYESTWGAINQAIKLVGVVPWSYGGTIPATQGNADAATRSRAEGGNTCGNGCPKQTAYGPAICAKCMEAQEVDVEAERAKFEAYYPAAKWCAAANGYEDEMHSYAFAGWLAACTQAEGARYMK